MNTTLNMLLYYPAHCVKLYIFQWQIITKV